eukprot:TRINITY_DN791_c1_g3_i1.p1 TRINITY_DN791_c1_g3~~TRINITY_DN791_c1_g3_i1.p1  ORF type:complete len:247 (+),score=28.63 TRINITY_DN791_c1_g3_i1:91-831(+)
MLLGRYLLTLFIICFLFGSGVYSKVKFTYDVKHFNVYSAMSQMSELDVSHECLMGLLHFSADQKYLEAFKEYAEVTTKCISDEFKSVPSSKILTANCDTNNPGLKEFEANCTLVNGRLCKAINTISFDNFQILLRIKTHECFPLNCTEQDIEIMEQAIDQECDDNYIEHGANCTLSLSCSTYADNVWFLVGGVAVGFVVISTACVAAYVFYQRRKQRAPITVIAYSKLDEDLSDTDEEKEEQDEKL